MSGMAAIRAANAPRGGLPREFRSRFQRMRTFCAEPPRAAHGNPKCCHNAQTPGGPPLNTLRILIAEDHDFQRQMLAQALHGLGAVTVHCAANGHEAMRIVRDPDTPVDIVITDLMMPDVDGIELIPMLRESRTAVSIVLSSTNELALQAAEEIARGYGVPVLGVVTKPITPASLRPLLERYLAARAQTRPGDSEAAAAR